ncbi:hypothetical protein Tco_1503076 [Tanacetum coccineum]
MLALTCILYQCQRLASALRRRIDALGQPNDAFESRVIFYLQMYKERHKKKWLAERAAAKAKKKGEKEAEKAAEKKHKDKEKKDEKKMQASGTVDSISKVILKRKSNNYMYYYAAGVAAVLSVPLAVGYTLELDIWFRKNPGLMGDFVPEEMDQTLMSRSVGRADSGSKIVGSAKAESVESGEKTSPPNGESNFEEAVEFDPIKHHNFFCPWMNLGIAFGAFLDPVADKLMVAATLVLLCTRPLEDAMFGQLSWPLTVPSI